jgi:hypothetical protein
MFDGLAALGAREINELWEQYAILISAGGVLSHK